MGAVFAMFAGFYYWLGLFYGFSYPRYWARLHFWFTFMGVNITFFPLHFLGISGMPRRIPDYPDIYWGWNFISSVGSILSFFGLILFILIIFSLVLNFYNLNFYNLKYILHSEYSKIQYISINYVIFCLFKLSSVKYKKLSFEKKNYKFKNFFFQIYKKSIKDVLVLFFLKCYTNHKQIIYKYLKK
jgi:heme/copper-type cytochrome/quinol oxidase subunit 1